MSVKLLLWAVAARLWLSRVNALPGSPELRKKLNDQINAQLSNNSAWPWCFAKECKKPEKAHELILPVQAGLQWMNDGGYCGSWSIQRAVLAKGAWISQGQVRAHAKPGGGHDTEILATNIDAALQALKLKFEGFDYKHLPTPQADAYRQWIKKSLVAGNAVVWMIMQPGEGYPVYSQLPNNSYYGHIEPVVGILSDHPLNDTRVYDDDYIVHFTDADFHSYYRTMASLPETAKKCGLAQGNCHSDYVGYPAINDQYGFGWSIQGFADEKTSLPISLQVNQWHEPEGSSIPLKGTLTISGLKKDGKYAVYRWDSVESAFDYSKPHSVHRFSASADSQVYADAEAISSSGTTYYRCIEDNGEEIIV
eukprot:TRINITY_DN76309_c0_g1_i1.p1 TRINITY_DN76309_c0_g1~~TRINITY_DN76309_c0_g1_i1.p1  ORF type:complete len:365 (-),score=47.18 TRINITY_DN76309_c0_g1_i1:189-1283(-)